MQAIIHNIRSQHNVGSIFRTADAAGVEKIFLTGYTPSPIDRFGKPLKALSKVALGAEKSITWVIQKNVSGLIKRLKSDGYIILAIEQTKSAIPIDKAHLTKKQREHAVLLMGNEVRGLSPKIIKMADQVLEIPMLGKKESLNVSVAFGVAAYWLNVF